MPRLSSTLSYHIEPITQEVLGQPVRVYGDMEDGYFMVLAETHAMQLMQDGKDHVDADRLDVCRYRTFRDMIPNRFDLDRNASLDDILLDFQDSEYALAGGVVHVDDVGGSYRDPLVLFRRIWQQLEKEG